MIISRLIPFVAMFLLVGCATSPSMKAAAHVETPPSNSWHSHILPEDRARLRDWRTSFERGIQAARTAGYSKDIDAEGALLFPDAALQMSPLLNGLYRCRTLKLGAQNSEARPYRVLPDRHCRVSVDGQQHFGFTEGTQRPQGIFYSDTKNRSIFLGTMIFGDEHIDLPYGRDVKRNMVGILEKIADQHWRIILPDPHFESLFDVIDLRPEAR